MDFDLKLFSTDDITGGDKLAKYVSETFTTADDCGHGFVRFSVMEWNDENNQYEIIEGFEWLENDIHPNVEVWVCWDIKDGEMLEWWITGDNI